MKLTAHVVVIWPKGTPVDAGRTRPHAVYPWIEFGSEDTARQVASELAQRHEDLGWPTDQVTVAVESTTACPTSTATALALHQLGHRNAGYYGALLVDVVDEHRALDVTEVEATDYLLAVHNLHVATHQPGYDTLVLGLARRATLGDPHAVLALVEIATEVHRAIDPGEQQDSATLTSSVIGCHR